LIGVRCPLLKYKPKQNKLSWVAGLGCVHKAVLLFLRLSFASEGKTGVVPPSNSGSLPSHGSHKVHCELKLANNAPPWPLKRFQLQLIVQLQVQLHSKVKSKSLHVEFS
jgi:hypothetical protein